jgi:DNA-binding HxlR family transcriptional regulator
MRWWVAGISERMLSQRLRDMAVDGFVTREVFREIPPRSSIL